MPFTLGVIGCGKMAHAILSGLVKDPALSIEQLLVNDVDLNASKQFAEVFNAVPIEQKSLVKQSDIILLAVKPNQIEGVLLNNKPAFNEKQLIISIAAGIKTSLVEDTLDKKCAVVRVMPNTPALVGAGVTAVAAGKYTSQDDINMAKSFFAALGSIYLTDEKNMDAITAISGSGPAYIYLIVESLINAGVLIGLDNNFAKSLVLDTMKGSIKMMETSGKHPAQLREEVCSPAGTTIEAIRSFEENGLRSAIFAGVEKAFLRSQELGRK